MKLVAISRFKNEIDIVEAFVRHTASFVDVHLTLDNGSTDGTLAVLRSLATDGLSLEILEDSRPGDRQVPVMNDLMQRARAQFDADWVLPLDADEFLGVTNRRSLELALSAGAAPALVSWRTYVPEPTDDASQSNPVLRIRHRLQAEGRRWCKAIVPGDLVERATLEAGNHDVRIRDEHSHDRRSLDGAVTLCHFPIRSPAQYAAKVAIGNLQHVARGGDRRGFGGHYEGPFRLLLEDWSRFAEQHYEAAKRFALLPDDEFDPVVVDDPISYRGGPLRFTPPLRPFEPWTTILEYTTQLAQYIGATHSDPP